MSETFVFTNMYGSAQAHVHPGKDSKTTALRKRSFGNGHNLGVCREIFSETLSKRIAEASTDGRKITLENPQRSHIVLKPNARFYKEKLPANFKGSFAVDTCKKNKKLAEMFSNKEMQKEVFSMMDVVCGPVALLFGGTGHFFGQDKRTKIVSSSTTTIDKVWGVDYQTKNIGRETHSAMITYDGVSNFWIMHPVLYGIVSGLCRQALDEWTRDRYQKWDKTLHIETSLEKMHTISTKESLSPADKKFLLGMVTKISNLVGGERLRKNLAYYPINPYTRTMFTKLLKEASTWDDNIAENWKNYIKSLKYVSYSQFGFYSWIELQKTKSKKWLAAASLKKTATNCTRVGY